MDKNCKTITGMLTCPALMLWGVTGISLFALAAALTSEVAFGLEPCILCIYQRIPYAAAVILGVIGLLIRKNKKFTKDIIALCGLGFLVNSGIALYHSGVERHWWKSAMEGCAVPDLGSDPENIIENILSAPSARCDEIPWADPILGLSMANYNVILCFGLFAVCMLSFIKLRQAYSKEAGR